MAASIQENLLSEMLPKVMIEKITLSNILQDKLKIELKLIVKETLDNDFFGTWFDSVNIKKYVLINAIQCTDPLLTKALSFSNDMVAVCDNIQNLDINDMKVKALGYILNQTNLQNIKNLLENNIISKVISISNDTDGDTNIEKYSFYYDDNGNKIYEIPYNINFEINNLQPENLSYFVTTRINLTQFCSDFGLLRTVIDNVSDIGKTSCEIVLENGNIVDKSYMYLDEQNVIWEGPIHQDDQGNWKTGSDTNAQNSKILKVVESNNTKVQDFRDIQKIQNIFNSNEGDTRLKTKFSSVEQSIKNIFSSIQQKSTFNVLRNEAYSNFSDISLAKNVNNEICYSFKINFFNILKKNSRFSSIFYSDNQRFKSEAIKNIKISNIKLLRRRVKNNIKVHNNIADYDVEPFDVNEPDYLVISSKDNSWKDLRTTNNQNGSISEIDFTTLEYRTYNELRAFGGTDKKLLQNTDGIYQYGVELEIEDGIEIFIKTKIQQLEKSKNKLLNYYSEIISTKNGYDLFSNKLSQEVINKLNANYTTIRGGSYVLTYLNAPWVEPLSTFVDILDIFSENIRTNEDKQAIIDSLSSYLLPATASIESILKMIELFDYFIASINRYIDNDVSENNTSQLRTKPTKTLKISHFFKELIDVNTLTNEHTLDYLSPAASGDVTPPSLGLTLIDVEFYRQRIAGEILKYFRNNNPNLNITAGNKNINIDPSTVSYSYLSPDRIDFFNDSYMLSEIDMSQAKFLKRKVSYLGDLGIKGNYSYLNLHSLILQNKFSNTGAKPIKLNIRKQDISKNLNNTQTSLKQFEHQVANRIMDLFANIEGLKIEPIDVSIEKDENGKDIQVFQEKNNLQKQQNEYDTNELYGLLSSLSNPIISSNTIRKSGIRSVKFKTTKTISRPIKDFVRELSTIKPTFLFDQNSKIMGFKNPISQEEFKYIPNQLKAIILKSSDLKSDILESLKFDTFKNNMINKQRNYYNFNMLVQVEYLSGFENIPDTKEINIRKPIWKLFTKQVADKMNTSKKVICRIQSYSNNSLNIAKNVDVENNCYDKYFIIQNTNASATNMVMKENINNPNALANNLIDQIARQMPSFKTNIVPNSMNVKKDAVTAEKLEITKIDSNNKRETIIISQKETKDTLSKVDLPESQKIAIQTAITQLQNSYIKNTNKTTMQIPSRNITKNKISMQKNSKGTNKT